MEGNQAAGLDPLHLWTPGPLIPGEGAARPGNGYILKTSNVLWSHISQMNRSNQIMFMNSLISDWPYFMEKQAFIWPTRLGFLTSSASSGLIASKICADLFLFNKNAPLLEIMRNCPKVPIIFGMYTSAFVHYAIQQTHVLNPIFREEEPCSSCIITRNVVNGLFSGIIVPLFSLPYLCYYMVLQAEKSNKYPAVRNLVELFCLSWEGSKASWKVLPYLITLHITIAIAGSCSLLWSRKRIFDSIDADPELTSDLIRNVELKISFRGKIETMINKFSFFRSFVDNSADPPSLNRLIISEKLKGDFIEEEIGRVSIEILVLRVWNNSFISSRSIFSFRGIIRIFSDYATNLCTMNVSIAIAITTGHIGLQSA
ncbi:unnamed protein product [Dracunculus medinensis]|uniref:Uncharacterized protein n=1 Tax=Dracunculus medinensis TaxID=318479 RepID=A0A0N4UJ92_DRAME|nr:unnamed protein product [Dracunculus medinensis]